MLTITTKITNKTAAGGNARDKIRRKIPMQHIISPSSCPLSSLINCLKSSVFTINHPFTTLLLSLLTVVTKHKYRILDFS